MAVPYGDGDSEALRTLTAYALASRIGEREWARLEALGFVSDALAEMLPTGDIGTLRARISTAKRWERIECQRAVLDLVALIRGFRRESERHTGHGMIIEAPNVVARVRVQSHMQPIELTEEESAQAYALSALHAARASKLQEVIGFREQFLGGHPYPLQIRNPTPEERRAYLQALYELTHGRRVGEVPNHTYVPCPGSHVLSDREALRFLRSPALTCFSAAELARWDVPLLGHRARWTILTARHPSPPFTVFSTRFPFAGQSVLMYTGKGTTKTHQLGNSIVKANLAVTFSRGKRFGTCPVHFLGGSVLAELAKVAKVLAEQFHWPEEQAAWWVLTGRAIPMFDPFGVKRVTRTNGGYVELRVAHWIQPDRVKQVYTQCRMGGQRARARDTKTLLVAQFVLLRHDPDGELRVDWETLYREWNRDHPDLTIKESEDMEQRALDQARKWNNEHPSMTYSRCCDFKQAAMRGLRGLQGW